MTKGMFEDTCREPQGEGADSQVTRGMSIPDFHAQNEQDMQIVALLFSGQLEECLEEYPPERVLALQRKMKSGALTVVAVVDGKPIVEG